MNEREYNKHLKALVQRALLLSESGLQLYLIEEYNKPEPDDLMFDVLSKALVKKMGKRRFDSWIDTVEGEVRK